MKEIYKHHILDGFTQDQREEIWHAYREVKPNWIWSLIFFGLWLMWVMVWMVAAQYWEQNHTVNLVGRIGVHLILSLGIGVVGGVVLFGRLMLPKRIKQFHAFLDKQVDRDSLIENLELNHLKDEEL